MDQSVEVLNRVIDKHRGITREDVISAWNNRIRSQVRLDTDPLEYLAAGFDGKGRMLQMVVLHNLLTDEVVIFHAMKITNSVKIELDID